MRGESRAPVGGRARRGASLLKRVVATAALGLSLISAAFAQSEPEPLPQAVSAPEQPVPYAPIFRPGSVALTGFSGTTIPYLLEGLPDGLDPVDETFIDTLAPTLRVFDVSNLGGPAAGQMVNTPPPFHVSADLIGQVFGVAFDDGLRDGKPSGAPNLYAAASSMHGVRIVTPDEDGDGRAERQRVGKPGATFMAGQFAVNNGGGPGSIWKIDGLTGAVTLFANIDTNSGPGLGNIAFDRTRQQIFASDLDTGLIHRISLDGALVDTFDHGLTGPGTRGLPEIADDGAIMDIQGGFNSEDPETWGMTQDARRVWGLAVHGDRLYYAVSHLGDIWSVGLTAEGGFANDPQREIVIEAPNKLPVTAISFDGAGVMYLAQRGASRNAYDYSELAESGKGEVLRYAPEQPDDPQTESRWRPVPETYASGFPAGNRQSNGGVDLQYGYDRQGRIDPRVCTGTMVNSGDRLRDNPEMADRLAAGGPASVQGFQMSAIPLVRPQNQPPFGAWFVDYDDIFDDASSRGQVGDIAIWRPCPGGSYAEATDYPIPEDQFFFPFYGDSETVDLWLTKTVRRGYESCERGSICRFEISIRNASARTYTGPLTVLETYRSGAPVSSRVSPQAWRCEPAGAGQSECTHPGIVLPPGASTTLTVDATIDTSYEADIIENCAELRPVRGERDMQNNRACATQRTRKPKDPPRITIDKSCPLFGPTCRITVSNTGAGRAAGMISVVDAAALIGNGAPVSITGVAADGPEWVCGPTPSASLQCQIPGQHLAPGSSRHIDVTVSAPAGARYQNCASARTNDVVPRTHGIAPIGRACADGRIPGPDLEVEKTGDARCVPGEACSFTVSVRNAGDGPFNGELRIGDAVEIDGIGRLDGAQIQSISPPLGCASEPTALPLSCVANVSLAAGETRSHEIVVVFPDGVSANENTGGQNCVGFVPPGTPVALAGTNIQGQSRSYACHRFEIGKRQPQCSRGLVANADGRCVCPQGTRFRNGQCTPTEVNTPPPVAQCRLLPGQIRTESGRCVCPRGTELKGGRCVEDEPQQCRLLPGQVRTESGRCVCPRGTELKGGRCVEDEPQQCRLLPGQIRTESGRCVCPRGTELRGGRCVEDRPPVVECRFDGQVIGRNGQCICPRGERLIDGACRRPRPQCEIEGQVVGRNGQCVCPRGTRPIDGACRRPAADPPPPRQCEIRGQLRADNGDCFCPRGTRIIDGACRRPVADPPPPRQCEIPGQIMTRRGACVCPRGTRVIDGACRRAVLDRPPPIDRPPPVRGCAIPGQILHNGQCFCPRGTRVINGACRPPVQIDPRILDVPRRLPREPRVEPRREPRLDRAPPIRDILRDRQTGPVVR